MEKYHDDVSQTDGEERHEEPVILDSGSLEKLSWEFAGEIVQLVDSEDPCSAEISPRISILKAKLLPKRVLQCASLQMFHHLILLIY